MELLARILSASLVFLQQEFTFWDYTFSYWQIGLFLIAVEIVLPLLWRFLHG